MMDVATQRIRVNPSVYNEIYKPLMNDTTRTQIIYGGSSSGKSYFEAQRMLIDVMKGDRNYLAVRNVARTLRTTVFNEVKQGIDRMGLNQLFKANSSDMSITCIPTDCQILMCGLDDTEKIKGVRPKKGVITDIFIEEATETDRDSVKQLRKRLRGKWGNKKRITLMFNPIYKTHWIYKDYFAGKWTDEDKFYRDDDLLILKTTYLDNLKHLSEEDIKELTDETDKYWHDVYTLGNWGVLGDLIFTNWKIEDLSRVRNTFDDFYNGLDFGYSNDPTAALRTAKRKKIIYILDEPIYEKGLGNDLIAEKLLPCIGKEYIRCDSAEPKSIAELRKHNINAVGARKGKDSVLHGIQYLQQHEIVIDKQCQNVINEFQTYQWDKDKDGETINKPIDKSNHAIDGLRYAHERLMKPKEDKPLTKAELGLF